MSLERQLVGLLQQMYVSERDYQMYLCDWAGKTKDQQLKTVANAEVEGIGHEMANVRECLSLLGAMPNEDMISPIVKGLMEMDQCFLAEKKGITPGDMDIHVALTDVCFGSAEIGQYQGMLTMVRALKRHDIAGLLEQTLQREEEDLQEMTAILNDLINLSQPQQKAA